MFRPIWPSSEVFKMYLLHKGNCCSLGVLVVVLWLMFGPYVCAYNMHVLLYFRIVLCYVYIVLCMCTYLLMVDVISPVSLCVRYCLWWWRIVLCFYNVLDGVIMFFFDCEFYIGILLVWFPLLFCLCLFVCSWL
jgi:hypothetical protein